MPNKNHSGVKKRIEHFLEQSANITIYGFDRGYGSVIEEINGINIQNLGLISNQNNSLFRIYNLYKILNKIITKHKNEHAIFYTFSFDIALILYLSRKKYVYEIRDLVYGYFKIGTIRGLFKFIDKILIKNSIFSVLLSEGFIHYLYNKKEEENIILQPNKIHHYFNTISRPSIKNIISPSLRFGFVGNYRFPNTVMRFAKVIGTSFPNHTFSFYGDGIPEYKEMVSDICKTHTNVFDFGVFKNPLDLQGIYENIDVLIACYDASSTNVRYAEPNKLYEAIFFNTPIVVSENTFLSTKVIDTKSGYVLKCSNDQSIINFINQISINDLNHIKKNMINIDNSALIDDMSFKIVNKINAVFTAIKTS